ncbi:hypothetical protein HY439_01055 [Candidatus Microgenomates bacterium]|nr:hypothetical protein [Candidatus Microgenomates bacterium]
MATKSQINRLPNSTFELTITVPWSQVKFSIDKLTEQSLKEVEVKGFRKGKAPKKIAEQKLDKDQLFQEAVRQIVPEAYLEAIKTENLHPIVNPKIELLSFKEGEDWIFKASACEKPKISLGNYKEKIKEITAKSKIVVPGKENNEEPKLDEIVKVILESAEIDLPQLLIENEVNRLLAKTLDEIKALGLTLEQYLSSVGKTPEGLREEYTQKAANDLKLEFILEEIAETESITVTPEDIEKVIKETKDPQAQVSLRGNSYLLAAIIRQQKTLDFIKNL